MDVLTAGSASRSREAEFSPAYVRYAVVLFALANCVNYMDRMALSALAPAIKVELGLSDSQLGLLIGFAFAVFYAVCGIFIARWADRGVRRNILTIALIVWSVMTAICGAARNFGQLFVARVGVGIGEAGCFPAGQSMLCDYVPLERRPIAFAINQVGVFGGISLGLGLAGWLGDVVGWRWAFVLLGIPGIILAALVWLTLEEPERGRYDSTKPSGAPMSFKDTIRALMRVPTYRLLLIEFGASGFAAQGLILWWPSFFSRVHGLGLSSTGISLAFATGVGGAVGLLIGGYVGSFSYRRDRRLPLLIGAVTTCLAMFTAFGSLLAVSATTSAILVSLTMLLLSIKGGAVMASIYSVVPASMRATAGAISLFLLSIIGFGLGPLCVGLLSDSLLELFGNESLRYALFAPALLFPVVAVLLVAASKTLVGDLRSVNGQ